VTREDLEDNEDPEDSRESRRQAACPKTVLSVLSVFSVFFVLPPPPLPSSHPPKKKEHHPMADGFIPLHGGYQKLKSYQKSVIILDGTKYFCRRFYPHDHRQVDQMAQAARSGKQNIAEGSLASATSKRTEIHLTNVAKASLGELLEDFEDFLRDRKLSKWDKNHPGSLELTARSRQGEETYEKYRDAIEHESSEISANTLRHITLQAIFLLDRQIQRLEQDFLKEGGIRERMTKARLENRNTTPSSRSSRSSSPSSVSSVSSAPSMSSITPQCPACGSPMKRRTARQGQNAGNDFWGCSKYPDCRGTRNLEDGERAKGGW
jgi:four helix bundle suffix protein